MAMKRQRWLVEVANSQQTHFVADLKAHGDL